MAKPTNAIANRTNPNDQFMIAVSHDIKEVIIKLIDLVITLKNPTPANTK